MKELRTKWMVLLLALPMLAWGCSDSSGPQTAQVSLALADAPGDVDSVWVEIGEIYLQGGNGRVTLLSEEDAEGLGLIELTRLAGTTLELSSDVTIPAGNYGQLRFVVVGGVLETEDGGVYTFNATHPYGAPATGSLQCPSCTTSGLKVLLPGEVGNFEGGSSTVVLLDFDVSQSFGHDTGGGGWVMHPVIRGAELAFSGAVSGTVDVARDGQGVAIVTIPNCPAGTPRDLTAFIPMAVAQTLVDDLGDPVTATAIVAADGSFSFPFLHPDQYDFTYVAVVDFSGSILTFVATDPGIVNVTDGADLDVTYTITSAICT